MKNPYFLFLLTFLLPSALCLLPSSARAQVYSISGVVYYSNLNHSVMDSCQVTLLQDDSVIDVRMTTNWEYSFDSLSPGTYQLQVSCHKYSNGMGSTDALAILKHFVRMYLLTGIGLAAADVSADGCVNAVDALLISKRFVGLIPTFPAGDWFFESPEVVITNFSVIQNVAGLCYGDVNRSWVPLNSH
ncbi:MAG: dockerin type I domain-containing protein [Bacteroidetes bacterium]|nr:dockerin type I domain-containing protein [Bacteroidota bacterium]